MLIEVVFSRLSPSNALQEYAKKRFKKVTRLIEKEEEHKITVTLSMEAGFPRVDAQLSGTVFNFTATEKKEADMYASIDLCSDHLLHQVRKKAERDNDHSVYVSPDIVQS